MARISRPWIAPSLVALAAWLSILAAMDPGGSYPHAPQGPGLTVDESFNVQQGAFLFEAVRGYGLALLDPTSVREIFGHPGYLPDHPPLGRFWLGLWHRLTLTVAPPAQHESLFVTAAARTGSAAAFGLTVLLVGWFTAKWYGKVAGAIAAVALVLMPRVYGHAHLASLETCMNLTWTAAVLSVAHLWPRGISHPSSPLHKEKKRLASAIQQPLGPSWQTCCWTGVLFGLALLTKIQGVLLVVPVGLWALWQWRQRAIVPLLIWGLTGFVVFFVGWPWLWLDPLGHLHEYFARTTERSQLYVWYFGQRYADKAVPWHYPFVMFLTTVPVGLQLLGLLGAIAQPSNSSPPYEGGAGGVAWNVHAAWFAVRGVMQRFFQKQRGSAASRATPPTPPSQGGEQDLRDSLLFATLLFPLLLFALPGVAVYDGARLFLIVFPLWAIFIGRGGAVLLAWLQQKLSRRTAVSLLVSGLLLQGYGLIAVPPVWLSYDNLLTGGLRGAEMAGLELNYWGDSITRSLLTDLTRTVPPNATVAVAPVLHQFQLEEMLTQSPILRQHGVRLQVYDEHASPLPEYLLLYRRLADLPPELHGVPAGAKLLGEVRRDGVQLAALYRL